MAVAYLRADKEALPGTGPSDMHCTDCNEPCPSRASEICAQSHIAWVNTQVDFGNELAKGS